MPQAHNTHNSTVSTCASNFENSRNNRLTGKHYEQCVIDRGLDPQWVTVNCRSMDIKEASDCLGYTAKSPGIWLEGVNVFGQYRPNKPWKADDNKKGKAPKYRTATDEKYDAMLPRNPHDPHYWDDLEALKKLCYQIDGHPCLLVTEGMFKAISGCSNGFPTVALAGVEQGLTPSKNDTQGKRYLVDTLERLCRAGFGFIIAFDADENLETNKSVIQAQRKLAHQLAKFKVPVYIITGLWTAEQGKGMDDYIQNNGADDFREKILNKAVDLEAWERQFKDREEDEEKLSESSFAAQLAENYRARMAWHVANKSWYWYETNDKRGIWGEIPPEEAMGIVITELETKQRHFSSGFVNGVLTLLKAKLRVNRWEVRKGFICLQDCVVDITTLKEYPHEPGYKMLTQLPFKWSDRSVGCEPIKQWLLEICENRSEWVQIIRAAINATVTERGGELQRFMELVGAGGTGKGTLLRLVQRLLGEENYAITDLKQLEQNRFETAGFYGKKGIFITDSERYAGDVSTLKKVTGNDDLRNEKKGIQGTAGFRFTGMVWIAANELIQSADYTNALARRRLSLPFERVIPPHLRRDLEKEFAPYLPGFLAWVLEMPADDVATYVVDTDRKVPSLASFSTEVLLETNPLASWADECLYYDPKAVTQIGDNNQDARSFLYPSYCEWAQKNAHGTMSKQRFSSILLNLLKSQLQINAEKIRNKKGRFITQVSIRQAGQDFPLLITGRGADLNSSDADLNADPMLTSVTTESIDSAEVEQNADLFTASKEDDSSSNYCMKIDKEDGITPNGSAQSAPSALARVSSDTQVSMVTTSDDTQVSTTQRIIECWDDPCKLGKIVLSLGGAEYEALVAEMGTNEIKHLEDAANKAWSPGLNRGANYKGDRVEIWEAGQSKNIMVAKKGSTNKFLVKRSDLRPWLGIW